MKKILMVPLLLLSTPTYSLSGLQLQQMALSTTNEAAMYQGYVIGVIDSTKHNKTYCIPSTLTNQVVLDTVMDYLDTHLLQEPAETLIIAAITEQFPCAH